MSHKHGSVQVQRCEQVGTHQSNDVLKQIMARCDLARCVQCSTQQIAEGKQLAGEVLVSQSARCKGLTLYFAIAFMGLIIYAD